MRNEQCTTMRSSWFNEAGGGAENTTGDNEAGGGAENRKKDF